MEKEYEHCGCEFHGDRAGCHSECATRGCRDFQGMFSKDVHTEHCCVRHGCRYGDENCSIVRKQKKQSYDCEICDSVGQEREEWIERLISEGYTVIRPSDTAAAG
jgi:hypothetical protein